MELQDYQKLAKDVQESAGKVEKLLAYNMPQTLRREIREECLDMVGALLKIMGAVI